MPIPIYPALEDAFLGLLATHDTQPIDLFPDTIVGVHDDIVGTFHSSSSRRRQMRYAAGAIIDIAGFPWAIGFGIRHCPDESDIVLTDIAAIRIVVPDTAGDVACLAPPPREPKRILHETLVTNENLEHSLVIGCRSGAILTPRDGLFRNFMEHHALPRIDCFIASGDQEAGQEILYEDFFPQYLQNCMHNALLVYCTGR